MSSFVEYLLSASDLTKTQLSHLLKSEIKSRWIQIKSCQCWYCCSSSSSLTSPKWGPDTKMCHFLQRCSAINYLSNSINILAGDDPVPVKFGPKGTDPQ